MWKFASISALALLSIAAAPPLKPELMKPKKDPKKDKVWQMPIVNRSIEHHGGDLYRHSETELRVCSKSGCFDVLARLEGGLFEYDVRGEVNGKPRRVRVTNQSAERWDAGEPVPLDDEGRQAARDFASARVYFAFLPFRLNDPLVFKRDLGLERWGERELQKVKVTFAPGSSSDASDEYLYWFDPETGRVEQFAYSYAGQNPGLRFRRAVNHRRVGGILFFDQENLGVEGPGLTVDAITPEFVRERMKPVSTVTLENIRVKPLPRPEPEG